MKKIEGKKYYYESNRELFESTTNYHLPGFEATFALPRNLQRLHFVTISLWRYSSSLGSHQTYQAVNNVHRLVAEVRSTLSSYLENKSSKKRSCSGNSVHTKGRYATSIWYDRSCGGRGYCAVACGCRIRRADQS